MASNQNISISKGTKVKTLGSISRGDGSQIRCDFIADGDQARLVIFPMKRDVDGLLWSDLRRHPITIEAEHLKEFTAILQLAVQEVIRREMRQSVIEYEQQRAQASGKP